MFEIFFVSIAEKEYAILKQKIFILFDTEAYFRDIQNLLLYLISILTFQDWREEENIIARRCLSIIYDKAYRKLPY